MDKCPRCGGELAFKRHRELRCGLEIDGNNLPKLFLDKYIIYFYPEQQIMTIYSLNEGSHYLDTRIQLDELKYDITIEYIEKLYLLK